jgi:hypothetical protein
MLVLFLCLFFCVSLLLRWDVGVGSEPGTGKRPKAPPKKARANRPGSSQGGRRTSTAVYTSQRDLSDFVAFDLDGCGSHVSQAQCAHIQI